MDDVTQFKEEGDVKLTVPLAQGFDRILFDFIQITASKSGFDGPASNQIAERVSKKVFEKIEIGDEGRNHQEVEVSMSHRRGQITIKTEILALNFCEEEQFKIG